MPIVGSYTRTNGVMSGSMPGSSGVLHSSTQKLPYRSAQYTTTKMFIESHPPDLGQASVKPYIYNALHNDSFRSVYTEREAVQLARSRLNKTLINGRAALGITAATANQSFGMIASRTSLIVKAYMAARRGNVRALARLLRFKLRKKKISSYVTNDPAGLWLEFTFGWAPLLADIHEAIVVLSDPFEVARSYGTATVSRTDVWAGSRDRLVFRKKTRAVCTAGMRIDNPNIALMTQLGLSNPAAIVWDTIPFSFVIDWFLKVNRFVNTWNDMAGFSYVDPVTTIESHVNGYLEVYPYYSNPGYMSTGKGRRRERKLDIVNKPMYPSFSLPTPNLWLAATSTALAVQIFKKK